MKRKFSEFERIKYTKEIILEIFHEPGISKLELEQAICSSYSDLGQEYKSINDIPMDIKIEAICDCCEAAGLKFDDYDDILNYFYEK